MIDRIFIPSMSRPNKVLTNTNFLEWDDRVCIVVRPHQFDEYREANPNSNILVIDDGVPAGIGATRQWILDYARSKGFSKIGMMDDDVYIGRNYHRVADGEVDPFTLPGEKLFTKYINISKRPEDVHLLKHFFSDMSDVLDEFVITGMVLASVSCKATKPRNYNYGFCANVFINLDKVPNDVRFDTMDVKEDFNYILELLTRGIPNVAVQDWCIRVAQSNQGGCSDTRTLETHNKATLEYYHKWEQFCRLREATSANTYGGQMRYEINHYWKRAYQWGTEHGSK